MSNLMVTILSILLVAVLAIGGIYYGGGAFQEAQAKARAQTVISAMQQVLGAMQSYAVDHSGNFPPWSEWTTPPHYATSLLPGYLNRYPLIPVPSWISFNSAAYISRSKSANSNGSIATYQQYNALRITLTATDNNRLVCEQVNAFCQGSAQVVIYNMLTNSPANFQTADIFNGKQCVCFGPDIDGSNAIDNSETYWVEWAFGPTD